MTRAQRSFFVAVLLVFVGGAALAWRNARETVRLRDDSAAVRTQLAESREEQRRALARAQAAAEARDARSVAEIRQENDELVLLRAETHALTKEFEMRQQALAAQMEKSKAELAAVAERKAKLSAARPPSPWKNVGRANPAATFQSVLWAVEGGDAAVLGEAIALDPDAQREAERFFAALPPATRAEYGDAQKLVASVLAANLPASFAAMNATKETSSGPDDMAVTFELQRVDPKRRPQSANLHFHRANGNWQLLVPAKVIEGYRHLLTVTPSGP